MSNALGTFADTYYLLERSFTAMPKTLKCGNVAMRKAQFVPMELKLPVRENMAPQ